MQLQTSRFGTIEINPNEGIFKIKDGLAGFSGYENYTIVLDPNYPEGLFVWLQSADKPDLAFAVTEPRIWFREYSVMNYNGDLSDIGLRNANDQHLDLLTIVNKYGNTLTTNLGEPIVVNRATRQARQIILPGHPIRQELLIAA